MLYDAKVWRENEGLTIWSRISFKVAIMVIQRYSSGDKKLLNLAQLRDNNRLDVGGNTRILIEKAKPVSKTASLSDNGGDF